MAKIKGKAKATVEANIRKKFDWNEVKDYIYNSSKESSIYFGCDSRRFRKRKGIWYADYAVAIVIHKESRHGCRVFGYVTRRKDRGSMQQRLLMEAQICAETYLKVQDVVEDRHVELHLDINSDRKAASNGTLKAAYGLIKGMTGISPVVKPDALASSFAAHAMVHGLF